MLYTFVELDVQLDGYGFGPFSQDWTSNSDFKLPAIQPE